jgi:protein O-mannosyl-transferase
MAALAAVCIALYLPMLRADFVWDARCVILTNDYVQGLQHLPEVLTLRVMGRDVMDNNRPVFLLSAMLDYALWGRNPFGFHLTNLLLHALVTVLLFAFARRLLVGAPWAAFFGSLLFAVHPLNCEAVAEISYRKDLIAAAGILAGLNLAAVFQPRWSPRNLFLACASVACLVLAVGAKENGVAGPPTLVVYWLLFRRREPQRGWIVLSAASALAVTAFLVARFTASPQPSIIFTEAPMRLGGSFLETLRVQPRIWAFYLRQIVAPMDLCADYGPYTLRNFGLGLSLAVLLAVAVAQAFVSVKSRVACLGTAIFWLSLLPVSNLVPIYRPMADRFLYLPLCGVALMLAALGGRAQRGTRLLAGAALLVAGLYAFSTFEREHVWQNSGALWRDTLEKNPLSSTAANNLAQALIVEGKATEAAQAAERAIQLTEAKSADPFALLAIVLDQLGRAADADAAYKRAVALDARYRNPDSLVKALIWEVEDAQRLEVVARRN